MLMVRVKKLNDRAANKIMCEETPTVYDRMRHGGNIYGPQECDTHTIRQEADRQSLQRMRLPSPSTPVQPLSHCRFGLQLPDPQWERWVSVHRTRHRSAP